MWWTSKVEKWADANGWAYVKARGGGLAHRFRGAPFAGGLDQTTEIVAGTIDGTPITAFQYSYDEYRRYPRYAGGHERIRLYAVVVAETPATRPMLQISRENLRSKVLDAVGFTDFQTGDAQFDSTFHLRTDHAGFARDILNQRTRQWMLGDPRSTLSIRFEGSAVLAWERGGLKPDWLTWAADYLIAHLDAAPPRVWPAPRTAAARPPEWEYLFTPDEPPPPPPPPPPVFVPEPPPPEPDWSPVVPGQAGQPGTPAADEAPLEPLVLEVPPEQPPNSSSLFETGELPEWDDGTGFDPTAPPEPPPPRHL